LGDLSRSGSLLPGVRGRRQHAGAPALAVCPS